MFGGFSGFLGFDVIAFFGSWVVLVVRVGDGSDYWLWASGWICVCLWVGFLVLVVMILASLRFCMCGSVLWLGFI